MKPEKVKRVVISAEVNECSHQVNFQRLTKEPFAQLRTGNIISTVIIKLLPLVSQKDSIEQ